MYSERKDSDLIHEFLQSRTEDSFLALYRRHTPSLYLFALRLTGGLIHDAEDIVQETWVRAIRKLTQFHQESKLRNWLMGIASNCYRELKRKTMQVDSAINLQTDFVDPPRDLEELIRSLPDGSREVLILHDLYGYTHEEIAAQLDIHAGTSKSQLFEARTKLRSALLKEAK